MSQTNYSVLTVQSGQVSGGPHTDFPFFATPVLSGTANRFRFGTGNGGRADGRDIRPYTSSAFTTLMDFERDVPYNSATGMFGDWLKHPSMQDGATVTYGYGDASLSTDVSNHTAVWGASTLAYHLGDGSSLVLGDSGTNNLPLAQFESDALPTAAAGTIGGAASFDIANNRALIIAGNAFFNTLAMTMSLWLNTTATSANLIRQDNTGDRPFAFVIADSSSLRWVGISGGPDVSSSGGTFRDGGWHHVHFVLSGSGFVGTLYIDGVQRGTHTSGSAFVPQSSLQVNIGAWNHGGNLDGSMDEIRISNTSRSGGWATTEYNNQFAPTTFATFGTEQSVGGGSDAVLSTGGTSVFSAIGASLVRAASTLAGVAVCAFVGTSLVTSVALFDGISAVSVVGTSQVASAAAVAGISAMSSVGNSEASTIINSAGVGALSGIGAGQVASAFSAAGIGTLNAQAQADGVVLMAGSSSVTFVGASQVASAFSASGVGDLSVTTQVQSRSVVSAVGVGSLNAVASGDSVAQMAGTSAAIFVGASQVKSPASMDGLCTASFTGIASVQSQVSLLGSSAVAFVGASQSATAVSAAGTSNLDAIGSAEGANVVVMSGTSAAVFIGLSQASSVVATAGVGAISVIGAANVPGILSAAGIASFLSTGRSQATAIITAAGSGNLTAASIVQAATTFAMAGVGSFNASTLTEAEVIDIVGNYLRAIDISGQYGRFIDIVGEKF